MESRKRRVAVFTGSRSEYGLQMPILRALAAHPTLEYCLLAGGAHLDPHFGKTLAEIEADGFRIHSEIHICQAAEASNHTARSIADCITSVSAALAELKPDLFVAYGDRFESFAAVIAATQSNVPTAHIEGGDYTEGGALDDSVRHAMTKLAHLHFTTNRQASERVLKLGEEPWRVHTVGLPALDLIVDGEIASTEQLADEFSLDLARPVLLFCQHSVTTELDRAAEQVRPSLAAIGRLAQEGCQTIITYPNDDAGGRAIIVELEKFMLDRPPGAHLVRSLGRKRFHGMLNLIGRVARGALLGNSSAGIKETPAFGCPAVNIGSRQRGRLRASNLIDAEYDVDDILAAARRCMNDELFRSQCRTCQSPYGAGNAGQTIAEVLATVPLDARLLQKRMTY